mgnify:FL=1
MLLAGLSFAMMVVLLLWWYISEKKNPYKEEIEKYSKEYLFSMFFSVAYKILLLFGFKEDALENGGGVFKKHRLKRLELLRKLYGNIECKVRYKLYLANMISAIFITVIIGSFLVFTVAYKEGKNSVISGNQITRPAYNEESKTVNMKMILQQENNRAEKNVEITIDKQTPSKEQAQIAVDNTLNAIASTVLNGNENFDKICADMNLITYYKPEGVSIEWTTDNPALLGRDGTVANLSLKEPVVINVTAVFSVQDVYSETMNYSFTILPHVASAVVETTDNLEQKIDSAVVEVVDRINQDKSTAIVNMPQKLDSDQSVILKWKAGNQSKIPVIILVILFFGGILLYYVNLKMKEELEIRSEKIKQDFPEVLNKLILLITAGTTVQTAMEKIVGDYSFAVQNGLSRRPLYEELLMVNNNIKGDRKMHYTEAYELFAKRCMVQEAIQFSALMIQYMKDGSDQFVTMLKLFSGEAWQERKRIAERRGKAAENKLLLPIMMIFLAILMIVLTPITMLLKI